MSSCLKIAVCLYRMASINKCWFPSFVSTRFTSNLAYLSPYCTVICKVYKTISIPNSLKSTCIGRLYVSHFLLFMKKSDSVGSRGSGGSSGIFFRPSSTLSLFYLFSTATCFLHSFAMVEKNRYDDWMK